MDEFDIIFRDAQESDGIEMKLSIADKIIISSENEFVHESFKCVEGSKEDEKEKLKKKLHDLNLRLKKLPNIKNPHLAHLNAKRSEKRKELKKEIELCKMRLDEISYEEEDKNNP